MQHKRSASIWGPTPSRFYRFIRRAEKLLPRQKLNWCILGCSDGKFVLPVARKGHKVLAIDVDRTALFGGKEKGVRGTTKIVGLVNRLYAARLEQQVKIKCADYVAYHRRRKYDVVFSSGSIHYSLNKKRSVRSIIKSIQNYVRPGGLLYIDYMLEPRIRGRKILQREDALSHFFTRKQLETFFNTDEWQILFSKVLPEFKEEPHIGTPFVHYHQIGYFCVRRKVRKRC